MKRATSDFLRHLGDDRAPALAQRVVARHIGVLGGAESAASEARAGKSSARRLGTFLSSLASGGLDSALAEFGLGDLVGKSRLEILEALATAIGGNGASLDAQAARDAVCDALEELFGDALEASELGQTSLSVEEAGELQMVFLTNYIYNRSPVVAEKLNNLTDHTMIRQADELIREIIREAVSSVLESALVEGSWPTTVVLDDAMLRVYRILEGHDLV
jgi:hypothetical protein